MTELRATYRIQMGPETGFARVRDLVPYLRELGVSHLYLSPIWQAREGSTHGYDVVDPRRISDVLGGEEGFRELAAAGMPIVLDVVPNHMATDDANPFWRDEALRVKFFDIDPETGRHRRFFDIDHLAGVRQEDPEVFAETHAKVLELGVDGLRIDHPDGLADPLGYLESLRAGGAKRVWVEKILDPGEQLREDWPVSGTTGYEFLNDVCALFVDPAAEEALTNLYGELTGERREFGAVAHEAKLEQARTTFSREVEWLERLWPEAPFDVAEAVSSLPVYRTYGVDAPDWLADAPGEFVTRFQQTTPPVMAKGVEDTAFYRYARLLALNDVGGDPSRFGIDAEQFHAANALRAERWPEAMLTLTTHDTKRSADVRARLAALTWLPDEWAALARAVLADAPPPDAHDGYFLLQTVVAAPLADDRIAQYTEKALRERKVTSNWLEPDTDHERAMAEWASTLMQRDDVRAFTERLAVPGRQIALAFKLLQLTAPGVPDIYQGDEDAFLALVDPDNRRPVDWDGLQTRYSEKLSLTRGALATRPAGSAAYEPVAARNAIAYVHGDVFAAAALRPGAGLPDPPGDGWREVFATDGVRLLARG